MIKYLQKFLGKLGEFEIKHSLFVFILILLFTGISLVGITNVTIESDFSKFDPKGIPAVELTKEVDREFSSFSSIVVIVQLEDENNIGQEINDIRNPRVMEFLVRLENNFKEEQKITGVFSAGTIFQQFGVPPDLSSVKSVLSQVPQASSLFNKRYSMTPVFISADVGADSSRIEELNNKIKEIIDNSGKPGGVKVIVTGEPPLLSTIFRMIINDAFITLIIAAGIIFLLLLIIQRSVKRSLIIMIPVLLGIVWTAGILGWTGTPITIATAAMGAMLLGLGVEYSIFLNSRFMEEKRRYSTEKSIVNALSTTGASTVSSGITTLIGFFALTLSLFPMLSDMGFTLAAGIFFVLSSTMINVPLILIFNEKLEKLINKSDLNEPVKKSKIKQKESKALKVFENYGNFVSNRPFLVIILALLITGILFVGISRIKSEDIDFDTILPSDLPELVAFNTLENEFGNTFGTSFYIQLDSSEINSDEPIDIRDPRVINYVEKLSEKANYIDYAVSVNSISILEKKANNNIIPQSLEEQKLLMNNLDYSNLITKDFSGTLVKVEFDTDGENHREEIVRQIYELIETTEKPAGVKTSAVGGMIANYEVNKIVGSDSSKTALIAFAAIVVFLYLLSRSIKYTILPLITVIVAIVWILGLIGYLQIPFNSIISSVISMTIGIGIDFGIQLSMRFRQELTRYNKKVAMRRTLKYTLYPMVITVIAAVIGFRSMTLGRLRLMENLGNTLILGVTSSMFVEITLVAGLIIVIKKKKNKEGK